MARNEICNFKVCIQNLSKLKFMSEIIHFRRTSVAKAVKKIDMWQKIIYQENNIKFIKFICNIFLYFFSKRQETSGEGGRRPRRG